MTSRNQTRPAGSDGVAGQPAVSNREGAASRRLQRAVAFESLTGPRPGLLLDVLSNARRRWVCQYLDVVSEATELGDLAEFVAAVENGVAKRDVSSAERKRVYISLYQCHLPKMDDVGAVRFDQDRKSVRVGPRFETFTACLASMEDLLLSMD